MWRDGSVRMIDQTALPQRLVYKSFDTWQGVADAIRRMVVRGAPAIGVAAAMGVAVAAHNSKARTREDILREVETAASGLRSTRPTAVNLFWGIDKVVKAAREARAGRRR
jgi:methylthioribose-1-phosphate isomerase